MNENYLLYNETAKKLYFEYAKDLPIINISSREPQDKIYSNIAEAYLFNDSYKCLAMKMCGVDDEYVYGDASDYEKFKEFCRILPQFIGNPIYLLSHIELSRLYDCHMDINEENAEKIWMHANKIIAERELSEQKLFDIANMESLGAVAIDWRSIVTNNNDVIDCNTLEKFLIDKINKGKELGCKLVICSVPLDFQSPHPYKVNEIINKIKSNKVIHFNDDNCLLMQIIRILGIQCKKLNWRLVFDNGDLDNKMLQYLDKNDALPKIISPQVLELAHFENCIEKTLFNYAQNNSMGNMIYVFRLRDIAISYSRHDYFRRVVCNIVGQWVENGEYTSDEKTLRKLIEDILYNNLKEAIS